MSEQNPGPGVVYSETVVHAAPEPYVAEAPYQIAIIALDAGGRLTARICGERVAIGDRVRFREYRNHYPVFERSA